MKNSNLLIRLLLFLLLLAASIIHARAQLPMNGSIITGYHPASRSSGSSCPEYDSIGVMRTDSLSYVILCCAGGCDTLPIIVTPGGGALALWTLQGNSITQVDTSKSVFIQDTLAVQQGQMSAVFSDNEILYYIEGAGDTTLYLQTDTSLSLISIRDGGRHTSSVISEGFEAFMNKRIPLDNATITYGIDSTRFYWDYDLDVGTDTIIASFGKNGEITFPQLGGSGTRVVSATSTGVLQASSSLLAFTLDGNENMFAGVNALPSVTSGGFNYVIGTDAGAGNNSGSPVKEGNGNVLIGYACDVSDTVISNGVVIGFNSVVGENSLAIGGTIQVPGTNAIGIGTNNAFDYSIGFYSEPSDTAQFVALPTKWFLNGITRSNIDADTVSINAPGTSGINSPGSDFFINAGYPTGNATPGQLIFQTAPSGASGSTPGTLVPAGKFDASTTAGQTRFFLYDVDNGRLERVTVGAADSGGAGFKVLRIPN